MAWLLRLLSPRAIFKGLLVLGFIGLIIGGGHMVWELREAKLIEKSNRMTQEQFGNLADHLGQESRRQEAALLKRDEALQAAENADDSDDPLPESIRLPAGILFDYD